MLWQFLLAFFIALPLVLIFALLLGRPGPWALRNARSGILLFFLIVLLSAWAGGVWLNPLGPSVWGIPWGAYFFAGVAAALIIAALGPVHRGHVVAHTRVEGLRGPVSFQPRETETLFWIMLVGLVAAIIIGYSVKKF